MQTLPDAQIQCLAESCVSNMGDVFWDFHESRDVPSGFQEPRQIATEAVASTLQTLATVLESNPIYTVSLRLEYREIVRRAGENAADADIIASLVSDAAWTEAGARTVLELAQRFGTSILRNALALAEALDVEDGRSGL